MTEPTVDQLKAWISDRIKSVRDSEGYVVKKENEQEFLLLYGVCAQVARFSNAYLRLSQVGFGREGRVLARAALEHAVTAQWVYLTEGGIDRFRVSMGRTHKQYYSNISAWSDLQELTDLVEKLPDPDGDGIPRFFKGILRKLDQNRFLETSYSTLSQVVHVTHSASLDFLENIDDEYHVKYEQDDPWEYQTAYVLAVSCMLVSWLIARLTDDKEELAHLDRMSDELVLSMSLADALDDDIRRHDE